jgi:hypothetical protein
MREIAVSTAAYAAIWAARKDGEESESQILDRLLGVDRLKSQKSALGHADMGKVRWVDDVVTALKGLRGGAHYAEIYRKVREVRTSAGRSVPRSFEEVVRKEIETHSSDSSAYQGREDYFRAPRGLGEGYWELR